MKQLTIFDCLENEIRFNDLVKIISISEREDSELHHYRNYYYPHIIGKVGQIMRVDRKSYLVRVLGEDVLCAARELKRI